MIFHPQTAWLSAAPARQLPDQHLAIMSFRAQCQPETKRADIRGSRTLVRRTVSHPNRHRRFVGGVATRDVEPAIKDLSFCTTYHPIKLCPKCLEMAASIIEDNSAETYSWVTEVELECTREILNKRPGEFGKPPVCDLSSASSSENLMYWVSVQAPMPTDIRIAAAICLPAFPIISEIFHNITTGIFRFNESCEFLFAIALKILDSVRFSST